MKVAEIASSKDILERLMKEENLSGSVLWQVLDIWEVVSPELVKWEQVKNALIMKHGDKNKEGYKLDESSKGFTAYIEEANPILDKKVDLKFKKIKKTALYKLKGYKPVDFLPITSWMLE